LASVVDFWLFALSRVAWKTAQLRDVPVEVAHLIVLPSWYAAAVWVLRATNYTLLGACCMWWSWKVALAAWVTQCLSLICVPIPYGICVPYLTRVMEQKDVSEGE